MAGWLGSYEKWSILGEMEIQVGIHLGPGLD